MNLKYERVGDEYSININGTRSKSKDEHISRLELLGCQIEILQLAINDLIKLREKEYKKHEQKN